MSMHIVPPNVWKVERDKLIWIYTRGPARRAMQGLQHQLHRGEKSHKMAESRFFWGREVFFWLEEIDLCALRYIRQASQAASHQAMQKGHQERVVVIILSFSLGAGLVTLAWGKCYMASGKMSDGWRSCISRESGKEIDDLKRFSLGKKRRASKVGALQNNW